ncbi:MAG: hypothetical protein HC900_08170 [Methylacidiphilales bacterium]|nr:hypothetical protein [Candidatus Methylacidiphilales bacterium]
MVDDYFLVGQSWHQWFENPFYLHGRPMWTLSYLLVDLVSTEAAVHRLVNIALLIGAANLAFLYAHRLGVNGWAGLLLCVGLTSPSLVWPATWIAQRNDVLLLFFLMLALVVSGRWSGLIFLQAATMSKSPFVFHILPFVWRDVRKRRVFDVVLTVAVAAAAIYFVYKTYYLYNFSNEAKQGLYIAGEDVGILVHLLVRGAKVLEGLAYNLFPVPAFASSWQVALGAFLAMLVGWALIVPEVVAGLRRLTDGTAGLLRSAVAKPALLTVLMSASYTFGSGLRMYCPTLIFLYTTVALLCRPSRRLVIGAAILIGVNLWGIALTVPAMDTGCHQLHPRPGFCDGPPIPVYNWAVRRQSIVDEAVRHFSK